MNNRHYILAILLIMLIFLFVCTAGCKKQEDLNNDNIVGPEEKQFDVSEEINTSYYEYNGVWSENGAGHDEIIENGGVEFSVKILNDNELNGTLFSQQATSGRIAQVDNITGKIENGECYYEFEDDGWGNSGILYVQFKKDEIIIEVQNVMSNNENTGNFGLSGSFLLTKVREKIKDTETNKTLDSQNMQTETYAEYYKNLTEDDLSNEIEKRKSYLSKCSFYNEVLKYMESNRTKTDVSLVIEPLFNTDQVYYSEEDFKNEPPLIIYLAKNEIYARHGYIFKDYDLSNYFNGQIWYSPLLDATDFSDKLFNSCEIENLKLLVKLDTYKK